MAIEINLEVDYFDHIKTIRLVGLLGRGSEVLPIRLWCHVGKHHAESGKLTGYSPQEIETVVLKWWGTSGEAVKGLLKTGYLDQTSDGYAVHAWEEHNGHIVVYHRRAIQGAEARWGKVKREIDSNAKAMLKQCSNVTNCTNETELTKYLTSELRGNVKEIFLWLQYKKERSEKYLPKGFEMLMRKLEKMPKESRRASIEQSMANNWAGLFDVKGESNVHTNAGAAAVVPGKYASASKT
jgi:hypothetical protein